MHYPKIALISSCVISLGTFALDAAAFSFFTQDVDFGVSMAARASILSPFFYSFDLLLNRNSIFWKRIGFLEYSRLLMMRVVAFTLVASQIDKLANTKELSIGLIVTFISVQMVILFSLCLEFRIIAEYMHHLLPIYSPFTSEMTRRSELTNNMTVKQIEDLAVSLQQDTETEHLQLNLNGTGIKEIKALARALQRNTVIRKLDLDLNNIGSEGMVALAKVFEHNRTITCLDYKRSNNNEFIIKGVKILVNALKTNFAIISLDIFVGRMRVGHTEIIEALERNVNFARKVAEVFKKKLKGRDDAVSLFEHTACKKHFFKEVYELPISFADIQNLNIGGYAALGEWLIKNSGMSPERCEKLINSLKAVEHFIYLRDCVLKSYERSYLPFMLVALKNPYVGTTLQMLHFGDYEALKITCNNALDEERYQQIALLPLIEKLESGTQLSGRSAA